MGLRGKWKMLAAVDKSAGVLTISGYHLPAVANVLIVDDDLDGCEPVARALERMGHRVACAPNGREALAALVANGNPVELVILDIRMPQMDGMKLLEVMRSYLRW